VLLRKYEMPWRRAYEIYAGVGWLLAAGYLMHAVVNSGAPVNITVAMTLTCLLMALYRLRQALQVLTIRASLSGRAMEAITPHR
jgi:conjugal transfer pilus assembly protein TraD